MFQNEYFRPRRTVGYPFFAIFLVNSSAVAIAVLANLGSHDELWNCRTTGNILTSNHEHCGVTPVSWASYAR
jgi:hypothetical protein